MPSNAFVPPVREDLAGVRSYGAPQLDVSVRINVNENPFALPDEVADAIAEAVRSVATGLNRYPDRDALALRAALASYLSEESGVPVDASCIWAANGSNEVLHHVFLAFGGPGRTAVTFDPTYSMYPEYARDTFTRLRTFPRTETFGIDIARAVEEIADVKAAITVVASPNNPTGTAIALDDLSTLAEAAESVGGVLVVDEAYAEFRRPGTPSAMELLKTHPNVLVSRTMSKAFGLAGARLGYLAAPDSLLIEPLGVVRLPYHLSAITQAAALAALAHADVLQQQVALLREERDALVLWLRAEGYEVADSDANFVLFGRFADRHAVWQQLLDTGVLIRETGPQGWLRVSIGTPQENGTFKTALARSASASERLT
jgi:histidinol-phosphate aminotransferase